MMKIKTTTMIKNTDFINIIKRNASIDLIITLLAILVLTCHYRHGDYTSVTDYLQDVRLRNAILVFFYYSVSRLIFHFFKTESYFLTIIVLLLVSSREAYSGILQLLQGAPYPVGTMLNPNIFSCLLSIACSIIIVLLFNLKNRLLKIPLYIVAGTFAVLMVFSKSRLALLSTLLPAMCFLCLNPKTSGFIKKHIAIISIVFIASFAALYLWKKPSADGRLYMARIAVKIISRNWIWGTGPDSFAGAFGVEQFGRFSGYSDNVDINSIVSLDSGDMKYACTPMTAFNEYLRMGVEYGLVAMLLSFYIMVRGTIVLIRNKSPLGYGFLSLFVISLFSYPHCFSIYCLLLSVFMGSAGSMDCQLTTKGFRFVPWAINVFDVLFFGYMLFLELPQIEYRRHLDDKESDIAFFFKNEEYSTVCDYCEKMSDYDLYSLNLIYEYGISLSMTGQFEKSDSILRVGASRCSNPVFWHEIGHNHVRNGHYDEAEKSYIKSFLMVPNRMTPLLYLAQLYHHIGDTAKLERIASYSDKFKPKVPSYTTKEYHDKIKQLADGE
ncbi:MAG: O-antigen ligase family protein [Bacteroidaceae bacterium]|nr:O-antigen ligase family protein [Bacteroidaceae bacterium]